MLADVDTLSEFGPKLIVFIMWFYDLAQIYETYPG